jgi:hypothetical protein
VLYGFIGFDPLYFLFVAPAFLLALGAQWWLRSAYSRSSQEPARMSGYQAARRMLDSAGLVDVGIEQVPGHLSDHYDPREKVLRLSPEVFHGHSMAAVGIACHEAGHAIQDARNYLPLVVRNFAVPIANFGGSISELALMFGIGAMFAGAASLGKGLLLLGILGFTAVVFFQVVNLPVEFDASSRAKRQLVAEGIITDMELPAVNRVLNAAAMTYVAATVQAMLTLAYYLFRFSQSND